MPTLELVGSIVVRDLRVGAERWRKGQRLSVDDVERLAATTDALPMEGLTLLVPDPGEQHEDDAAVALAGAVGGPGLTLTGPVQSRVDLRAKQSGVLHVAVGALEAINLVDTLEVFTAWDGSIVSEGDLVASVKVAPHLVLTSTVEAGQRIARAAAPVVDVRPFVPLVVAAVARDEPDGARLRFERGVRAKVESLGSRVASIRYAEDDTAVERELRRAVVDLRADVVITAGAASTDPMDAFFLAIERLQGDVVRHGVPAHPGSMLWLARIGHASIIGLPTCGAYSMATAADLVLPRLLTGEPAGPTVVARLGHGGILTREQRFRFPAYARSLHSSDG